jgi:Ca2+-binding EF-hand superfamily protein
MTLRFPNRRLSTLILAGSLLASASVVAQSPATPAATPRPAAPTTATSAPRPVAAAPGYRPASPQPGQAATAEQLFSTWDKDRNKQLTLEEFRTGWEEARMSNMLGRLEEQFRASDSNHNGALDPAEYANLPVIKRSGATAPPMSTFDANKNNSLDFKEYLTLVQAAVKQNGAGH